MKVQFPKIEAAIKRGENPFGADDLARLQYWLQVQNGDADDPRGMEPDYSKLLLRPNVYFGCPAIIEWADGECDDIVDRGYLTTIPPGYQTDMDAVIHVPSPANPGGKGPIEAAWTTVHELLTNSNVKRVIIGDARL